jgi:ribokinase
MTDLDLLVLGDVNPDILVSGADPRFGQREVIADSIVLTVGGSAAIMAAAAARLGLRVAIVGVVGDDPFGRFMLGELATRGIDVAAVRVDAGSPTGATVILARPTDRAIVTATGTIADLAAADVPTDLLARSRHVHVASWFLQPALQAGMPALVERAHNVGATVSIDPNWDPAEAWDDGLHALLPSLDVFLPNDAEARAIAGAESAEAAARLLRGSGPRPIVAVKRGADGALGVDEHGRVHAVAAYPAEPVDGTGAGDAFDAAFLGAWLEGRTVDACLAAGAVAGALSTRALGGAAGQPTRAEVDAALAAWRGD